jgi:LCP family protein required for cell wall assembly
VNIIVVLACFVAGAALLWGKHEREGFQAAARPVLVTTTGLSTGPVQTDKNGIPVPPETFPEADPEAVNFLVAGADGKSCVDPDSPWANAADPARPGDERSDTIMVLRIDPKTKRAAALSFPRDLWVKVAGRSSAKINSAFVSGDYSRLAQTIYDNFEIKVDEYAQIDFCAFKRIVDAVGGVAVPFDAPVYDRSTGLDIQNKGCHTFSGDEALAYVRSRHLHWIDDAGNDHEDKSADLGRISRQQDFLRRTLKAALNRGIFNPSVARGLIDTLKNYVVFSAGLSINDMLTFAGVVSDIKPTDLSSYQVQSTRYQVGGQDALKPQLDGANMKAILDIFRGRSPLVGAPEQVADATTPTDGADVTSPPSDTPSVTSTTVPAETVPATADTTATTDTTVEAPAAGPESPMFGVVPPEGTEC